MGLLEKIDTFREYDKKVRNHANSWRPKGDVLDKMDEREKKHGKRQNFAWFIDVGSVQEGGMICRWAEDTHKDMPVREFEFDMMYNLAMEVPDTGKGLIQEVEGKPCFVEVLFNEEMFEPYLTTYTKVVREEINAIDQYTVMKGGSRYLSPERIRNYMSTGKYSYCYRDYESVLKKLGFEVDIGENPTGASACYDIGLEIDGRYIKISVDHVAAIDAIFWPDIAADWITRERKWPSKQFIDAMVSNGCNIVAKSSVDGDMSTEWRYSFAKTEREIAKHRSLSQQRVYIVTKLLFYKNLKSIEWQDSDDSDLRTLPSYLIKTVMNWFCEETESEDPIWNDDEGSLIEAVKQLLKRLLEGFEAGIIQDYFVPEINLIGHVPKQQQDDAAALLRCMCDDVRGYIERTEMEKISEIENEPLMKSIFFMVDSFFEVCKVIDNKGDSFEAVIKIVGNISEANIPNDTINYLAENPNLIKNVIDEHFDLFFEFVNKHPKKLPMLLNKMRSESLENIFSFIKSFM